ncbi:peptidylprolyl isomerase [Candidatus Oleimmundimicrobium sp.]|uniref:peptidylprolyl isomerase n=1 Tax=Candidatus Oleimmundimicrobium sp. TaxID=3060597 RepID=UPI0027177016|nr:peptidylprolyl isomerase [Candidatus Oleimmundimicrobium sp.]MDO8886296.1 peptidylprolyl isomerase [Candidatus Oleimmundimicrobium sp.]
MKRVLLVGLLIVGLFLVGCGNKVAVTVNGKKIYESEVEERIEVLAGQYPEMAESSEGDDRKELREMVLDNLISEALIAEEAVKQEIGVSKSEIDSEVEEIKKSFPDEQSFVEALKQNQMVLADLEGEIKKFLIQQKMMEKVTADIKITDEEVKKHYEDNKESFMESEQVHAKHILLEDEETAKKVLAALEDGSDFAELAGKHSTDPGSKDKGGDLGWMSRDQLVPEFAEASFNLPIGELSNLVKTQFGYHIIVVEEKKEALQKNLEDVKDEIEQVLLEEKQSEKFQDWIDDLKEKADIKKTTS